MRLLLMNITPPSQRLHGIGMVQKRRTYLVVQAGVETFEQIHEVVESTIGDGSDGSVVSVTLFDGGSGAHVFVVLLVVLRETIGRWHSAVVYVVWTENSAQKKCCQLLNFSPHDPNIRRRSKKT